MSELKLRPPKGEFAFGGAPTRSMECGSQAAAVGHGAGCAAKSGSWAPALHGGGGWANPRTQAEA